MWSARFDIFLEGKRLLLAVVSSVIAHKLVVVASADAIPGQPFYGYTFSEWLSWITLPSESLYVLVMTLFFYAAAFLAVKRLTKLQLSIWGIFLGLYTAWMFSPFDYSSTLERGVERLLPVDIGGAGTVAIACAMLGLLAVVIPLALSWLIGGVGLFFGCRNSGGSANAQERKA
jgi:hypothetical protein